MTIIHEPNSNVVKLVAIFEAGRDLESQKALAQSVSSMLKKCTLSKSNFELQHQIDQYAMNVEVYSTPLYMMAEMYCHKKFVQDCLPLFFEILFEAKFEEDQWKIVKNQLGEYIAQNEMQTDFWADKKLSEYLFGADHPLGYYSQKYDYDTIDIEKINHYYQENIQNRLPNLYLSGDIEGMDEEYFQTILSQYHLQDKSREIKFELGPKSPNHLTHKIENASQSSVRLGKIIPRKSFDNYVTIELYNMMIGGYYTSLLMNKLRIENGYTYGVYSHLAHFPDFSVFQISYECDEEFVEDSLLAIKEEFERLKLEKKLSFDNARRQYYSQWSKNAERSLQEIMYYIKMDKLGYKYSDYKDFAENYQRELSIDMNLFRAEFLEFDSYSKSIAN